MEDVAAASRSGADFQQRQAVFTDWEEFLGAVQPWDVTGCVLTDRHRPFRAEVSGILAPSFYVARLKLNRQIYQKGATPSGFYSFAAMTENSTPARFRRVDPRGRIAFATNHEFDGASEAGFEVILFGFEKAAFLERFQDTSSPLARIEQLQVDMLETDPCAFRRFERLLSTLAESDARGVELQSDMEANAHVDLLQGISDAVVLEQPLAQTIPSTAARRRALTRGLEFIEGNLHEVISIGQICSYAATSERTLEYAFREYCGVTPKAYLNARRLSEFRMALRAPDSNSVADVAGAFGYWHMGKLAGDYRAVFGELPSETILRVDGKSASERDSDARVVS